MKLFIIIVTNFDKFASTFLLVLVSSDLNFKIFGLL